jgi:Zn ribbon nucleic-acid-binding protein
MSEQGKCPQCKTEPLSYRALGLQDEEAFYPVECPNCGFTGKEWYKLEFITITDEEGEEV